MRQVLFVEPVPMKSSSLLRSIIKELTIGACTLVVFHRKVCCRPGLKLVGRADFSFVALFVRCLLYPVAQVVSPRSKRVFQALPPNLVNLVNLLRCFNLLRAKGHHAVGQPLKYYTTCDPRSNVLEFDVLTIR